MLNIKHRIIGGYHHLMGELYRIRIKLVFKHVDKLLKKNFACTELMATSDNWQELHEEHSKRSDKINSLFRKTSSLSKYRDRHWWKWKDAQAYYW